MLTGVAAAVLCTDLSGATALAESTREASDGDSAEARWSHIDSSRYVDVIRKTDRVTYSDAGAFASPSCDLTGDGAPDLVFVDPRSGLLRVVDRIPYGSATDEVRLPLADERGVAEARLPELSGGLEAIGLACVQHRDAAAVVIRHASGLVLARVHDGVPEVVGSLRADAPVTAVAEFTDHQGRPRIAAASGGDLHVLDPNAFAAGGELEEAAERTWRAEGEIRSLLAVPQRGDAADRLALGIPSRALVRVVDTADASERLDGAEVMRIRGGSGSQLGAAIALVDPAEGGGTRRLAIGAPGAFRSAGAVALVDLGHRRVDVATSEVADVPVSADGQRAGVLLRQNLRGELGTSLAWIDGGDQPGALLVGRPVHEEHPGALVISQQVLDRDWVRGRGIDEIPSSRWAWLASGEDSARDSGRRVGIVPRREGGALVGVYTGDSHGEVDVWTVDLSHQDGPFDDDAPISPSTPRPADPRAEPGVEPVDTGELKVWRGEFTSGFGGALARGVCDVTGDGTPDIVSGGVVRSEWKFDPYYADSTPTKGWVPNVTGQLQVLPGGMPGAALPHPAAITINGPRRTQDPAVDANVGLAVACVGDADGDGIDDLAVGSHTMGRVWVLYGGEALREADLDALDPEQGYAIELPTDGAPAFDIARVGDVDGDGLDDIGFVVANADYAMGRTGRTSGRAYVVKGEKRREDLDLTDLDADHADVLWRIDLPQGHTMNSLARIGDVNGDGEDDAVVTDFQALADDGRVLGRAWVVYGRRGKLRVDTGTDFDGYVLETSAKSSARLGAGHAVADLGDLDGDGLAEFTIGADGGGIQHAGPGAVAIVHGTGDLPTRGGSRTVSIGGEMTSSPGITVITGGTETGFGYAVDARPGDSRLSTRILIGASGEGEGGRAHLVDVSGLPDGDTSLSELRDRVQSIDSRGPLARFGRAVAFTTDENGSPLALVGGDGVIDQEPSAANDWEETKGYAHTAHILAMRLGEEPGGDPGSAARPERSDTPSGSGSPSATPRQGDDAESRVGGSAAHEPRKPEPRALDPRALDPRALDPREPSPAGDGSARPARPGLARTGMAGAAALFAAGCALAAAGGTGAAVLRRRRRAAQRAAR